MRSLRLFIFILITVSLVGCCAFVPCHPSTSIFGTVLVKKSLNPVSDATISLFNSKLVSTSSGCFKAHVSAAYPLTLSVSAPGYKPVEAPAKFGFYKLSVVLTPEQALESSSIDWHEISEAEFRSAGCL